MTTDKSGFSTCTDSQDLEIFRQAIVTWGAEAQWDMAIEECAELIFTIQKMRRGIVKDGYDRREHLIEEIADVAIMIEQCQLMVSEVDWQSQRESRLVKIRNLLGISP